uniref:UBA domain-containing protein n=1 Tax=Strongyloides stercoralis TaxID=6248 RepID=A0A0K0DZB9_STRER
MRVTVTNEEDVLPLEVGENIILNEFLSICKTMLPNLEGPAEKLVVDVDGTKIIPVPENLTKTIGEHNFKDGSFIYVFPVARLLNPLMRQMQNTGGVNESEGNQQRLPHPAQSSGGVGGIVDNGSEESRMRIEAKMLHDRALQNPNILRSISDTFPSLMEVIEKDKSFESFFAAFKKDVEVERRKQQLMQDEFSEEGQRYIAEQIQRQNIEENFRMAQEYIPETFFINNLLWIRLKINGVPVLGIVDSGCQSSAVVSLNIIKKCNLLNLVDKRYFGAASGIGGMSNIIGKIHSTSISVNEHLFEIPIQVLDGNDSTVLIGLDMLKRNQCIIDLQRNVLRFGDGTETPFLSEAEAQKERDAFDEQMAIYNSSQTMETEGTPTTFVADSEKLSQLLSMGFDEGRAREALKICDNNLELAVNFLFSN